MFRIKATFFFRRRPQWLLRSITSSILKNPSSSPLRFASTSTQNDQALEVRRLNRKITNFIRSGRLDDAKKMFDKMTERNTVTWNSMITGYVRHREMTKARMLFNQMPERDVVSWNLMLSGYLSCHGGRYVEEGRYLFDQMQERDFISWNTMITGSLVNEFGIKPRVEHFAALVDILGRHGQVEEAMGVICSMPLLPDKAVWGALLGACRVHNNVEFAQVAAEALVRLEPESSAPYVLLYNMYADVGRWDDATEVRLMMERNNIRKQPGYSWADSSA
ncbi:hypothetical protein RHGRI_032943 [Rhododendron griersonianum]|uniref:Pentatricopeptide repeat-containing protein n=1 Tax=Rhododendron griersonianum TaxID=479676 RepID=A0AAV6IJT4_9ERIC|nr:hypothetical protein RHGRI_032943 [Rhododendron griersonianum]